MSRKAKHNPGGSLLWLVAGAAGVYVLYQMMKPSDASAAEPATDTSTSPPGAGAGFVEGSMDLSIIDALPGMPGGATTEGSTGSGTATTTTTGGSTGTSTGSGTTTTTTTGGSTGGGNQGGGRQPIPRYEPKGGGSGSSAWVNQAQIYIPGDLQGLVTVTRSGNNDSGKITIYARAIRIPKPDEFAVFVTRASGMTSEEREKAAKVLIALAKTTSMTQADQKLADSRLRTLAAVEWATAHQSKPDISRMKYLYDRNNETIQYDPVKLAKASSSQTSSGSGATGGGMRAQGPIAAGGRGR